MGVTATEHFCPGCGAPLRHFERYPWYFCNQCLATAADCDGRTLTFGNAAVSGGLTWAYADAPEQFDETAQHVTCLIRERPVTVSEARFGGIVAQPVTHSSTGAVKSVDLTTAHGATEAKTRLRPPGGW